MNYSPEQLLEIGDQIVNWAKNGEQVEAVIACEQETEVRAYEGEVEAFTSASSAGAGIRIIADHRQGFAFAGSLDEDVLSSTMAEARDNAKFGTPDEFLGLASPDGTELANLDLYRQALSTRTPEEKIALALQLEKEVKAGDNRIIGVESCDYSDSISISAIVSTAGIRTAELDSNCYVSAVPLAGQEEEIQTGFGFSVGRDSADLDISVAAGDAVRRATRMLGATKPTTRRTTVLLDPWVSAQLLGIIGGTLSAEAVIKGRSLFGGRMGEQIARENVSLLDNPTNPQAFTACRTDGEGLATRPNVLIDSGKLETFAHNSYTARRMDTASTASAVRGVSSTPGAGCLALSLAPGERTQEELCQMVGDGVLVQSVSGLHSGVNPISGDFSTGAEGLLIRDGVTAEPIREFTIASTLQKLLLSVVEVGCDVEWLPMNSSGVSLVVEDVTISGE